MAESEFDLITLTEAIKLCEDIRPAFSARDTCNEQMENIYLLNPDGDLPDAKHIKKTLSPDGRNSLQGAVRLLSAADPKWAVPEDMNKLLDGSSSTVEKLAGGIFQAASRAQGKPRHYDPILSGLLYGEVIVIPTCTKDLVESAPPQLKKRLEDIYTSTPLLFDTISPSGAFPVYDNMGLSMFHSYRQMKIRDIKQRWAKATSMLGDAKDSDTKNVGEYWDYEKHFVWIEGVESALIDADNEWGFIPVSAGITEGSELFSKSGQYTRQPFLYTMWRSDMWKRQNLSLTVMFSQIFSVGANPQFVYQRNGYNADGSEKTSPLVDYSNVSGKIVIDQGETYQQLIKNVIDPSLMTGLDVAQQKGIESTIYRQALGEPLGGNAPFSMVAMLSQAGRLPLIPYQRMISHVLGDAMAKGLRMLKIHGETISVREGDSKALVEVDAKQLPDRIDIECTLDIKMPQDEAANAQTAMAVTAGDAPLMSLETAQKRYLNIEQPEEELQKVWQERAATVYYQQWLQQQIALSQQQAQPGQPGAQPGLPPGQLPPGQLPPEMMGGQGGLPQGMTPELLAQMQQGQMPQGMPNPQSTGAQPGIPGTPLPGPLPPVGQQEVM